MNTYEITRKIHNKHIAYPKSKNIVTLFEEQVRKNPFHTALIYDETAISYATLNANANCIARRLRSEHIQANDLVVVIEERGIGLIESILGILKSGAAYVPIDASYPKERILYMLENSRPKAIITDLSQHSTHITLSELYHLLEATHLNIPILEYNSFNFNVQIANLQNSNTSDDTFCVIYTSGTTGKPKGVVITHQNIHAYVCAFKNEFIVNQTTVFLQQSTYAFDVFTEEVYPTLLSGGTLCIVPESIKLDFEKLGQYIDKHQVTMISCSPLMLNEFKHHHPSVKVYISGGDVLKKAYYEKLLPAVIYNTYGPTETTVCATYYNCTQNEDKPIYIGKPIANTQIYILNNGELCDIGELGELYIGGDGVTKGYLHNEALTAERFIQNPFGEGKLYKTGDLGKWCADGNIEFVGRSDEQVKIRGFRVELKEIENALKAYPSITDCTILIKEDNAQGKLICAYIVLNAEVTANTLNAYLESKLPFYMLPAQIIPVKHIPMNVNGKVDREALLAQTQVLPRTYNAPSNEVEESIARMFTNILNVERVSVDDNFFYIGGHSLRALKLINEIEKQYNIRFDVGTIFQNKTVRNIAKAIINTTARNHNPIVSVPPEESYPMSSAQRRLYMISLIDTMQTAYNITEYLEIKGHIKLSRLNKAFQQLVDRHEILRTSFYMSDNQFYQHILPQLKVQVDYEFIDEAEKEQKIQAFIKPFDLSNPPLIRMKLFETRHTNYLVYDIHHMISDGMSVSIMLEELIKLYNEQPLEPLQVQYKDYCVWEGQQDWSVQKAYWLEKLGGELPVVEIPTDYKRPQKQSFKGHSIKKVIDQSLFNKIALLAQQTNTTEYMILISALMILIMKYTRQEDIVIGTPVANRMNKETEHMLGMFVNTAVLRAKPEKPKTYSAFLQEIRQACIDLYAHQDYPFDALVEALQIMRDPSRNPIFNIAFVLQNNEAISHQMVQTHIEDYVVLESSTSKFDITFNIEYKTYGYELNLEYCTDLYKEETINYVFEHYCAILNAITTQPQQKIVAIDMTTNQEKRMISEVFNYTPMAYPLAQNIAEMFEKQVCHTPEKIAVVYQDEALTYNALNEKANALAHKLREMGIGPNDCIPIIATKSTALIVGVLGIIKAGAAYVPIAPSFPVERIKYMAKDCEAKVVLTYGVNVDFLDKPQIHLEDKALKDYPTDNLISLNTRDDLIYIIYTSGTTGMPKGVMITHQNVIRLVYEPNYVTLNDRTVILQTGQMSFDASTFEVWGALLNGGKLVLAEDDALLDHQLLESIIQQEGVNTLWLTSTLFNQMSSINIHLFDSIKYLLIGGEKLSPTHVARFKQSNQYTTLINGYGPTESTTFTTTYTIPKAMEDIPIGKPINHTTVYVVNDNQLCGIGVLGELWIGGDGLAKGYLNNAQLNETKFVKSPFSNERLYKSGDLVKWDAAGYIHYVGRIDEQVKIRGFRIELGEIDTMLRKIQGINDCAVIVNVNAFGDKAIYAYLVADAAIDFNYVRNYLIEDLPEYMIPAYMMQISQIPVTKNGKLDRKALPPIETSYCEAYEAPENEEETIICKVFEEVLNTAHISRKASFYELGGDSIKAIRVVSKLREYGYNTRVSELLDLKTAQRLASVIHKNKHQAISQAPVEGKVEATPIIAFFKDLKLAKPEHFNQSMMLEINGANEDFIKQAFDEIVKHHDVLRAVFKVGKLYIRKANEGHLYDYVKYTVAPNEAHHRILKLANRLQESINLEEGPLVKLALFDLGEVQHLLIVIHHLVVDGVSWRIILEDFNTIYNQLLQEQSIKLPLKSTSYLEWSNQLIEYAQTEQLADEKKYWQKVNALIPKGNIPYMLCEARDYQEAKFSLDLESTTKLLTEATTNYNVGINELLITALGQAVYKMTHQKTLTIEMEGHGRENVLENVAIDRTVGWFTSIYPIVLNIEEDMSRSMAYTKELLHNMPHNGFGYNVLKYLAKEVFYTDIHMSFNYLGDFDEKHDNALKFSKYPCGDEIATENVFGRPLAFDGLIRDGQLSFVLSYDRGKYTTDFVNALIAAYIEVLYNMAHQSTQEDSLQVASDYGFSDISLDEFDNMLSAINSMIEE